MRPRLILVLVLTAISAVSTQAFGQDDPIELAKTFPPSELTSAVNEANLRAIDWQLKRKVFLGEQYRVSLHKINREIEEQESKVEHLAGKIPAEVRFVDAEVRSRLVGKMMEQLIDARLDLATQAATIESLQERMNRDRDMKSAVAKNIRVDLEFAVQAAQKKYQISMLESKKTARLVQSGSKSDSDRMMAQYTADISKLEFEKATRKLKNADSPDSKFANHLADTRIGIEPVKARIMAAEKFLHTFSESARLNDAIDKARRSISYREKDKQIVTRELTLIGREAEELGALRSLVSKAMKEGTGKDEEK